MRAYLDEPIIQVKNSEYLTYRDLTKGTFITGGTGSGKSSGSGSLLRNNFLSRGLGGLVLCVKHTEYEEWKEAIFKADRARDVIVFSPENEWRFNFLDYEMNRPDGGGEVFNIVNLFMSINKMGQESGMGKGEDRFWDSALKRLLTMLVSTIKYSGYELSIEAMYNVINSAPKSKEEVNEDEWIENSFCSECVHRALYSDEFNYAEKEMLEIREIEQFWKEQFADLDERTRSNIVESFLGLIEPFRRGLLKELLCTNSNCSPELIFENKILILNVPVTKYLQLGVYIQTIYKLLFCQAAERRKVEKNTPPIFLWVDEAQKVLTKEDALFLTTARSSRVMTVFITQNISNFYATIGGEHPEHLTNSLLSNLSIKFFHANSEFITNKYAADIIGQKKEKESTLSISKGSHSIGEHIGLYYQVFPVEFTTLKTGGESNKYLVDCILVVTGKTWKTGENYLRISLKQN